MQERGLKTLYRPRLPWLLHLWIRVGHERLRNLPQRVPQHLHELRLCEFRGCPEPRGRLQGFLVIKDNSTVPNREHFDSSALQQLQVCNQSVQACRLLAETDWR